METILHRGASWPVTTPWHEENTKPFPFLADLSRDSLRELQDNLLRKSDQSVSEQLGGLVAEEVQALPEDVRRKVMQSALSPREHALLLAANKHFNVRTSIDLLAGRTIADFGFEGADQLHHNRHTFECGCKLNFIFDHHRRFEDWSQTNERRHHPHYPAHVCDDHAQYADNLDLLHRAVHDHNRDVA